jgi:hypothetical protein
LYDGLWIYAPVHRLQFDGHKLRFLTGTTNHRVDVDTGAVILDGILDWHDGDMPTIAAAAYINNYGKPESAAMFEAVSTIVEVT